MEPSENWIETIPKIKLEINPGTGELEPESWADVLDNNSSYKISNYGRVISFKRSSNGNLLKSYEEGGGYPFVCIKIDGKMKNLKIHKLVEAAFMIKSTLVVDHIDNDKTHNFVFNLQHLTTRDNCSKNSTRKYSKHIGVSYHKRDKRWVSQIAIGGKNITKFFKTEEQAALDYQEKLSRI